MAVNANYDITGLQKYYDSVNREQNKAKGALLMDLLGSYMDSNLKAKQDAPDVGKAAGESAAKSSEATSKNVESSKLSGEAAGKAASQAANSSSGGGTNYFDTSKPILTEGAQSLQQAQIPNNANPPQEDPNQFRFQAQPLSVQQPIAPVAQPQPQQMPVSTNPMDYMDPKQRYSPSLLTAPPRRPIF